MNTEKENDTFQTNREILREIHSDTKEMKSDMTKIKTVVFGDRDAETPGLAQRVNKLEKDKANQNKLLMIASGIGTGIGLVVGVLVKYFKVLFPMILIFGEVFVLLILAIVKWG